MEARAYREGHSLRGPESGSWAKRAIPLLTEGRKPVGVAIVYDELAGEGFVEQRERDLKLMGYLNQTARALKEVGQRTQELALAGQVQASLLPRVPSRISDWRFAATLRPAKDTAGDFYDAIPLPGGRLGLVVADVTDKGMGAALYMALSQTLIRTYATEYPDQPDRVLHATSARILRDARAGLFVTVFYGILDPAAATLTYCNAGHHPPYLLSSQGRDSAQTLHRTGMALGVIEDADWERQVVDMAPGTVLLLYTDGVVDAHNRQQESFGSERMLDIAQGNLGRSPQDIQNALLTAVFQFVGDEPQFDDITLMISVRDAEPRRVRPERRAIGLRRLPPQEPI
jgi:sigma-B regulation protein RsbU (phosphoserine phosphatase)